MGFEKERALLISRATVAEAQVSELQHYIDNHLGRSASHLMCVSYNVHPASVQCYIELYHYLQVQRGDFTPVQTAWDTGGVALPKCLFITPLRKLATKSEPQANIPIK